MLVAILKKLFGIRDGRRLQDERPAAEPPAAPPKRSLFERLLGDDARAAHLDSAKRDAVLRYFATDTCERLLLLEKLVRGNEDPACAQLLDAVRRCIAEGTLVKNTGELLEQLRQRAHSLNEDDERRILCESLVQLLNENPEDMANHAFTYTMLRMVRYGGPFVDEVRRRHREWHEARLIWWVEHGSRLADMSLIYANGTAVSVPEEALMHHGIQLRGI